MKDRTVFILLHRAAQFSGTAVVAVLLREPGADLPGQLAGRDQGQPYYKLCPKPDGLFLEPLAHLGTYWPIDAG